MKTTFSIFFISILFLTPIFSQETGAIQTNSKEVYCLLVGTAKMFGNTVTIQVDYGQGINQWRPKESVLRSEETGEVAKFHSMIDALNYMAQRDWKFVNAYAVTMGQQNVYHWVLKKEVSE